MRALPHRDAAAVVETVRASGAARVVKLAFEVSGAHRGKVRRGARGRVGQDRHGRPGVDRPAHADQDEARAPGSAEQAGAGDPRCGAVVRRAG